VEERRDYAIFGDMSPETRTLLEQVQTWPEEDQEELAQLAREIVASQWHIPVIG